MRKIIVAFDEVPTEAELANLKEFTYAMKELGCEVVPIGLPTPREK